MHGESQRSGSAEKNTAFGKKYTIHKLVNREIKETSKMNEKERLRHLREKGEKLKHWTTIFLLATLLYIPKRHEQERVENHQKPHTKNK